MAAQIKTSQLGGVDAAQLEVAGDIDVGVPARPLPLPDGVLPLRIDWPNAILIVGYHLIALLAFVPWYFSWTGVVLAIVLARLSGMLGINLCYHRLLTHRGFKCPKWLEHGFVVIAICCVQDTPARWVAVHRLHHQYSDEKPDPHSPLVSFFWSHVGWTIFKNPDLSRLGIFHRYAKDILSDRFYVDLERKTLQLKIIAAQWMVFFAGGFAAELLLGGTALSAFQFGLSLLIWGVFVRTVLVWHQTWAINSVTHLWGYRNYNTDEDSRNNIVLGYLAHGEGWHNNHHADSRSARHGHRWWELDTTYLFIRLLVLLGLASHVVEPNRRTREQLRDRVTTRGSNDMPAT